MGQCFVCRAFADGNGNREAQKEVQNIALDNNFAIPGDPGFPLNQVFLPFPSPHFICPLHLFGWEQTDWCPQMFNPPANRQEAEILRQYLAQVRQELASRLLARIYEDGTDKPSKWWLSFAKRKFMGKSL
jgi:actin related protein 2/3 complex subunit 3